jgi:biopolymer transport protein ExbD
MSMDVGHGTGGLKADINVTPLVDVMLVLLIIMMLVAPMLRTGLPVTLPKAANTEPRPESQEQTVVGIAADGRLYLDSAPVSPETLAQQVADKLEFKTDKMVVIKADADATYASIMSAMDSLRAAKIENVALITERLAMGSRQ